MNKSSIDLPYLLSELDPVLEMAKSHYFQLVLILGGSWQERTAFLKEIALKKNYSYVSLGLPLSRILLNQPNNDRPMLGEYLSTIFAVRSENGMALDHIEILFDPSLKTDPLRLIQSYARAGLIVLSWPGQYDQQRLSYSDIGFPDHYSEAVSGLLTFSLEVNG